MAETKVRREISNLGLDVHVTYAESEKVDQSLVKASQHSALVQVDSQGPSPSEFDLLFSRFVQTWAKFTPPKAMPGNFWRRVFPKDEKFDPEIAEQFIDAEAYGKDLGDDDKVSIEELKRALEKLGGYNVDSSKIHAEILRLARG